MRIMIFSLGHLVHKACGDETNVSFFIEHVSNAVIKLVNKGGRLLSKVIMIFSSFTSTSKHLSWSATVYALLIWSGMSCLLSILMVKKHLMNKMFNIFLACGCCIKFLYFARSFTFLDVYQLFVTKLAAMMAKAFLHWCLYAFLILSFAVDSGVNSEPSTIFQSHLVATLQLNLWRLRFSPLNLSTITSPLP